LRILEASPRQYRIISGRLRADSLMARYTGQTLYHAHDLEAGASDAWDEASTEMYMGNFARAAMLYSALVEMVPQCSDCRVGLARALLGLAATREQTAASADQLRQEAADQLTIASALNPDTPVGYGIYTPPEWLGRTNIPRQPEGPAARHLFAAGNDAYNTGDFDRAREAYVQVLAREPRFGRGYVAIADAYYEEEDLRNAITWYSRALAADSTDYLAWRSLAQCYAEVGLMDAARDAALWAVMYDYQDEESWDTLVKIGHSLGFSVARCRVNKRIEVRESSDGSVRITVDSSLNEAARTAWLGYGFIRTVWRYEGRFALRYPNAPRYRPTFDEEMEAAAGLAAIWANASRDTNVATDPQLERIWEIAKAGYLGEYVVFEELAADNPDIIVHLSSPALTRIREYIQKFIIGGLAL